MLDKCVSYYYGQELTYDKVLEALGAVDTEIFSDLFRNVFFGNVKAAIKIVEQVVFEGRELSQFVNDFTWYLRNLMLVKTSDNDIEEVLDVTTESFAKMRRESDAVELDVIMRYIRVFSELSGSIKFASQKRIMLEMAIIKLCKPSMENDTESLADRIRQIEEKLENGVFAVRNDTAANVDSDTDKQVEKKPVKKEKAELPKALSDDVKKVPSLWHKIVPKLKDDFARSMFSQVNFTATRDNMLTIVMNNTITASIINRDGMKDELNKAIDEEVGAHVEIEVIGQSDKERFSDTYTDLRSISEALNFEIEEEDDNG